MANDIQPTTLDPTQLIAMVIDKGGDMQQLEKLMDLQERWNQAEAVKAFNSAMAEFKKNPPTILKNAHVEFTSQKGKTSYQHATLDQVTKAVDQALSDVGIAFRWRTNQEGGHVRVTCILTHELGHFEETTLEASPDTSGGKNSIQAIGSAVTYLQRYTLLSATGVAVGGMDNDGRGDTANGQPVKAAVIGPDLVKNLKQLIKDVDADEKLFINWMVINFKTDDYSKLTESQFDECVSILQRKAKKKTAKKTTKKTTKKEAS